MSLSYQDNISQPTKKLTEQVLKDLTESVATNTLIDCYRKFKKEMAEAEQKHALNDFVDGMVSSQDYQEWLVPELKKDEKRRKKHIPDTDLERVKLYISQKKASLPAVIPTAYFTESTDRWGRTGLWRVQSNGYLTGFVVLDLDHVPNIEQVIEGWLKREDFKDLGIIWIFITPSGEGGKVVFKARLEWGNLQDNAYEMADILGVLDYADAQCKNSDHAHFIPKASDVKFIDWEQLFSYENPAYEARYGEAYRRGESEPTQARWQELEQKRKMERKSGTSVEKSAGTPKPASQTAVATVELSERDEAIIKALNEYYPQSLAEGQKHPTFTSETSHWLIWLTDNNPEKAIEMALRLNWVKAWGNRQPNEIEDLIKSASKKKMLSHTPKALKELLEKNGIDKGVSQRQGENEDLPIDEWIDKIRSLFSEYPCLREVCEPHPERLWPFLFFAAAALMGTDMTLCWYRFYDYPEKMRRLNYNVLGVGDPASGKGALVRIAELLTEPMEQADQLANDAMNQWKEEQRSKGSNKDKAPKPKSIVRLHGARTSNNVFINDMVNAWTEVDGERMQLHMLTVDTEALNSVKMQKGGSWIDRQVMEIKSWSNEKDNQQYSNLDSVTGFFNVYWNQVRTCTPPALKLLANESNFGSGWPTRVSVIPVPGTGFKMLELRKQSKKALEADETLRQWAYRLDKRQGELPLWPLVEHAWHWTNNRMNIAEFNADKADELLLKRCSTNALVIVAPWIDIRHWDEREETGTYQIDDTDRRLCNLVLDIQYKTQLHWFYELHRKYYDDQLKEAANHCRRSNKFVECFRRLPDEFTTEQFTQIFGYANAHSAQKTLNRLCEDKAIERTMRGSYRKLVSEL
ncbi:MAG: hypothetical protein J6Y04_03270 [Bacteroidaceae bacterium]|nr:hypothetical protein [Bacteroidaceae bacterium]